MSRAALNKSLQSKARSGKLLADPFDILEPYLPSAEGPTTNNGGGGLLGAMLNS